MEVHELSAEHSQQKNMDGRQPYLCLSQVLVMLLHGEAALRCLARGLRL